MGKGKREVLKSACKDCSDAWDREHEVWLNAALKALRNAQGVD